jgi:murein DD-endopeptidase MepM/ murein hydrolase activator NlpD
VRRDGESWLYAALRAGAARLCARREILVRSRGGVRYVALPGAAQPVLIVGALALAGWIGWTSASFVNEGRVLAEKNREIAEGRIAYRELIEDLDASRTRFAAIAGRLETNHAELKGLIEQNGNLRAELRALHDKLQVSENARESVGRNGAQLAESLAGLKARIAALETRNAGLVAELRETEGKLFASRGIEREDDGDGDGADASLSGRLAGLQASQERLLRKTARDTVAEIARVEHVIADTGLDIATLLGRVGKPRTEPNAGEGGPYIPLDGARLAGMGAQIARLDDHMDRWRALQKVLHTLPLVAPVDEYWIASPFGKRHDPINGRWSMHTGIDLAGTPGSDVHATAPGVVVFVGWNGAYGKEVKIDHGLGVTTLYAHLSRAYVRIGQKIGYRQKIGRLGSTGRSTGPHVHYEVRLDDTPLDPSNFLKAGNDVYVKG